MFNMAEPTPGCSSGASIIFPSVDSYVPKSDSSRLHILRRTVNKLNEEMCGSKPTTSQIGEKKRRVFSYTGLHPIVIDRLAKRHVLDFEIKPVDRSVIYKQLVEFYLTKKIMPTTYQLFVLLEGKLPVYMDIEQFRKLLIKQGFMWKHIADRTFVVIEKPQVIFERHSYLKNMMRHRKEGTPIYFIDENAFDYHGEYFSFKQASLVSGKPHKKCIFTVSKQGVEFMQFINDFSSEDFLKWIKETLLLSLNTPSVIVINNSKHHCEQILKVPTAESTKKEMLNWLDYFKVPYDPVMAKPFLYELIIKYTDVTQPMFKADSLLRLNGHTVLRIPKCIEKLTPATCVFDIIKTNMLLKLKNDVYIKVFPFSVIIKTLSEIIATINDELANNFSEFISNEEVTMLAKDMAVDSIMDDLEDLMVNTLPKYRSESYPYDSDLHSDDSESE